MVLRYRPLLFATTAFAVFRVCFFVSAKTRLYKQPCFFATPFFNFFLRSALLRDYFLSLPSVMPAWFLSALQGEQDYAEFLTGAQAPVRNFCNLFQASPAWMRRSTVSRPNNSSTASMAGVCNCPATSRRTGMASLGIFRPNSASTALKAALISSRFHSASAASRVARACSAGRMSALRCSALSAGSGCGSPR